MSILINFRTSNEDEFVLTFEDKDTPFSQIRNTISEKFSIAENDIILLYLGEKISSDQKISDFIFDNENFVFVYFNKVNTLDFYPYEKK